MRKIIANVNEVKGPLDRFFSNCIGAGRAGEVMRYIPMQQLKKIQEECPFRYIRFHGLFHEEMNLVHRNEDGKLSFCFQYVDMLFDMLLENGIRPIAELGLMPDIMAKEEKYVFWWKMNISMPKDLDEWSQLVEAFVRHVTYRYGEEEIKRWYFEIWNEPNHPAFFTEYKNREEYYKLYDCAALTIKKVNPEYKVGGPATAGMVWIDETIAHCRQNHIPIDFITSHAYGVKGDFDADGTATTRLLPIDSVSNQVRRAGDVCKQEKLPLFLTEWSSSYSPRDPVHDSYFNAPYLLHTIKRSEGYADMFSYWTYTDVFEETEPPLTPFHGGFGLFNVQSIPKPSYHIYRFLHRLGDTELTCDDSDAYVCRSDSEVQVLFWNVVQPDQDCGNRRYFTRPLPAKELPDAELVLDGFEPGRDYTLTAETVGYKSGDPYHAYLDGNFTELPTREETAELIEKSKPKKTTFTVTADQNGTLHFTLPQKENQVDLVVVAL
ncbi:MAG: hypothetical protein J6B85_11270 [Lachnospiraceae bacterium]|nr:hypothetical protein [Lachnospiraceae bacterium]